MFEKLLGILHVHGVINRTNEVNGVNLQQLDVDLRAHYGVPSTPVTFIDADPMNKPKSDGPVAKPTKIPDGYWASQVAIDKRLRQEEVVEEVPEEEQDGDFGGGEGTEPVDEPKDDPPPEDPTQPPPKDPPPSEDKD